MSQLLVQAITRRRVAISDSANNTRLAITAPIENIGTARASSPTTSIDAASGPSAATNNCAAGISSAVLRDESASMVCPIMKGMTNIQMKPITSTAPQNCASEGPMPSTIDAVRPNSEQTITATRYPM